MSKAFKIVIASILILLILYAVLMVASWLYLLNHPWIDSAVINGAHNIRVFINPSERIDFQIVEKIAKDAQVHDIIIMTWDTRRGRIYSRWRGTCAQYRTECSPLDKDVTSNGHTVSAFSLPDNGYLFFDAEGNELTQCEPYNLDVSIPRCTEFYYNLLGIDELDKRNGDECYCL